jgi:hypothetical protein
MKRRVFCAIRRMFVRILGKRCLFLSVLLFAGTAFAQTGAESVLGEGTHINLLLNDYLSTKLNNEGDPFTATVLAPVYLKERIVIPKGSIVSGNISRILRPGRFKGKAVMNLLFSSLRLPGALEQLPIVASLARVDPEGNSGAQEEGTITGEGSKGKDTAKVASPTLTGAGIGAIVSGGKGAAIGAGVGAAVGIVSVLAGRGKDLEIRRGATLEIVLVRPLTIPNDSPGNVKR